MQMFLLLKMITSFLSIHIHKEESINALSRVHAIILSSAVLKESPVFIKGLINSVIPLITV